MADRRSFLKSVAATAAAGTLISCNRWESVAGASPAAIHQIPDTLDLADHGRLAINGMLGSINPDLNFESVFLHILDVHPPYMLHWSTMISGVMPKYIEALPMLRLMSGSDQDRDLQQGFMKAMLNNAKDDGLVYDLAIDSRPWNVGVYYGRRDWNEDYANTIGNSRMVAGFTFWHQVTGDESWKQQAKKTAERLLELIIQEGDYAWYPNPGCGNDFSYPRISGWTTTEPPASIDEGYEPQAVLGSISAPLRGFTRYYQLSGDERFLEISGKIVNFASQTKFWGGVHDMMPPAGAERGHFRGHFHAALSSALRGFLDYAMLADDMAIKMKVRDGYEWARQRGIHRLGIFTHTYEGSEGCTMADMVGLAVGLIDAGLGDYWDDVEMYARNGLISAQATDVEELKRVSQEGKHRPPEAEWGGEFDSRFSGNNKGVLPGQEIHERVLERAIGTFSHLAGARYMIPQMMSCCTANGSMGLYYAWEGILRSDGHSAAVNMWLNRRSPWVDVWSWLPYEGKLVLQNKGMRRISIRKPAWARPSKIRCQLNGGDVEPAWSSNRMVFGGLRGDEVITLQTPVTQDSTTYTMVNLHAPHTSKEQYLCEFKGHTALSVKRTQSGREPGEPYYGDRNWYRLFRREQMRAAQAPMKISQAYVHPEAIVRWTII